MNLRSLAKLCPIVASFAVLTGCVGQSTFYRAVSDMSVTRTGDMGSAGPLVLVAAKPGSAAAAPQPLDQTTVFDRMSLNQIGILDPHMGEYLRAQRDAEAKIVELRAAPTPDAAAIKDAEAKAALAKKQVEDYAREWRDMQRKLAAANGPTASPDQERREALNVAASAPAQSQTVLVVSQNNQCGGYDNRYAQTFVLILDGPPTPGEYWLTPDNSVLITASAWSVPARTRVGLTGSVKIVSVDGNHIVADLAVRKTLQADSAEVIDRLYDPAVYEFPWIVHGRHTFQVTTPADPVFADAAVHWVTQ